MLQLSLPKREVAWGQPKRALLGGSTELSLGSNAEVTLSFRPFALVVSVAGQPAIAFNSDHMFAFEHRREKQVGLTDCFNSCPAGFRI